MNNSVINNYAMGCHTKTLKRMFIVLISISALQGCTALKKNSAYKKISHYLHNTNTTENTGNAEKKDTQNTILENNSETKSSNTETHDYSQTCSADRHPNFGFKKRIAILRMPLTHRHHAVDMPRIETQYPALLAQKINEELSTENNALLATDGSHHSIALKNDINHHPTHRMDAVDIKKAARDLKTQFIIAGRLLDLSFEKSSTETFELLTSLRGWKNLGRGLYQANTDTYLRNFDIEIHVYDGFSGALIKTQRLNTAAHHKVLPGTHNGLNSRAFWANPYGDGIKTILAQQVAHVGQTLKCLPFQAEIAHVYDGRIEIEADYSAGLLPGHTLNIFRQTSIGSRPNTPTALRWQPYGQAVIEEVHPNRAVATVKNNRQLLELKPGDIVRAW